ncbi:hypothetical protein ABL78_4996 [Leptomonas seymouri]|uniref:RRM domain-containing protein n=1 Tax=Leptomonas seymouri TaxID=5684 RepID=A0A0N1IJR6_LEPSE|nr:hypothetical protein ABL78_4996 [Leptomonas seymouri]|eukprot:KPI85953.1 hypothetical protein ABL78_4996 [Leptomonas seymouri]
MVNAAAVVYVFLEDAGTAVSMEDITEWLQIIDEVVEMKLQYDATSKRTCYSVEFRKHTSAQQAIQYLNGSRFKNSVVSIRSRVFTAVEADTHNAPADGAPLASSSSAASNFPSSSFFGKRCRETEELPCNHLLPADLQMDQLLVEQLSSVSSAEGFEEVDGLWSKLKTLQDRLAVTYRDLARTREDLSAADTQLSKLLHVHRGVGNAGRRKSGDSTDAKSAAYPLAASHCVSHRHGIPIDAYTPSSVVSFVTSSFGPIAFYSVSAAPREFFIVLKFVFLADEERFVAASAAGSSASTKGSAARTEKEKALLNLLWSGVSFTVTPRDFAALSSAEVNRQHAVRQLLR